MTKREKIDALAYTSRSLVELDCIVNDINYITIVATVPVPVLLFAHMCVPVRCIILSVLFRSTTSGSVCVRAAATTG